MGKQIADAVWEGGLDNFTNIIDVCINYLCGFVS